jgi:hypothetical protein
MIIKVLPFAHVRAFCDVETAEIFISNKFVESATAKDIAHEIAHIEAGDADHGPQFIKRLSDFGYSYNQTNDIFKDVRKRIGIKKSIGSNVGNISGIQNILLDYHLLAAYRKFSQKILGTEGHWEVINEGNSDVEGDSLSAKDQKIRLYPTPKGAFPVTVLYIPVVTHFRSPQARQLCYDLMLAEARIMVGNSRRKISGMPTPDGGSISYDGSDLVQEGETAKEKILEQAINLGEPMGFWTWNWLLPVLGTLIGSFKDVVC